MQLADGLFGHLLGEVELDVGTGQGCGGREQRGELRQEGRFGRPALPGLVVNDEAVHPDAHSRGHEYLLQPDAVGSYQSLVPVAAPAVEGGLHIGDRVERDLHNAHTGGFSESERADDAADRVLLVLEFPDEAGGGVEESDVHTPADAGVDAVDTALCQPVIVVRAVVRVGNLDVLPSESALLN